MLLLPTYQLQDSTVARLLGTGALLRIEAQAAAHQLHPRGIDLLAVQQVGEALCGGGVLARAILPSLQLVVEARGVATLLRPQ